MRTGITTTSRQPASLVANHRAKPTKLQTAAPAPVVAERVKFRKNKFANYRRGMGRAAAVVHSTRPQCHEFKFTSTW